MRITNMMKEKARDADLISFMNEKYPNRLIKCGNYWRDSEYPDTTIWYNVGSEQYKFKAHSQKSLEHNEEIVGSDTIAYVRKFLDYSFTEAVEELCKYPQ